MRLPQSFVKRGPNNGRIKMVQTVLERGVYHYDSVSFPNIREILGHCQTSELSLCFRIICNILFKSYRVAKFACPRVLDNQKKSEDNQKLRSGCPPDYQIFWEKYFENNSTYKFFKDFILALSFSNKHISFW